LEVILVLLLLWALLSRNPHRDGEWLEEFMYRNKLFVELVAIRIVMENGWKAGSSNQKTESISRNPHRDGEWLEEREPGGQRGRIPSQSAS